MLEPRCLVLTFVKEMKEKYLGKNSSLQIWPLLEPGSSRAFIFTFCSFFFSTPLLSCQMGPDLIKTSRCPYLLPIDWKRVAG